MDRGSDTQQNPVSAPKCVHYSISSWHVLWVHQWLSLKLYEILLEFWHSLHHSFSGALHSELAHDRREREVACQRRR